LAWATLQVLPVSWLSLHFTISPYHLASQDGVSRPVDKLQPFIGCIWEWISKKYKTRMLGVENLQSTLWWSIELVSRKGENSLSGCHCFAQKISMGTRRA
jgi:hypothetical protein